ncbi:MAG: dual specificity protein phosphatase family protein [Gemmataceae bacterium]|nr:dual specificity protein phosphatase family protein [Gemmataceae bacterium]
MPPPESFSWVEKPLLAGFARPMGPDELQWLRNQGLQLLVSLTENPVQRSWINDAGMFALHVPVEDMTPPSQKQFDLIISAIEKAHAKSMGVGVHCGAGMGRTGAVLACWLTLRDMSAPAAIARIRELRPGSIETPEQVEAVLEFARRHKKPPI